MTAPLFAPREHDVARVALPVPIDRLFDYAVPAALSASARPGCRVRVRLRRRLVSGVIVERGAGSDFRGRLAPIEQLIDPEPVLSPALLGVLREAAIECLCPIGLALAAALPAGSAPRSARGFQLTPRGQQALASAGLAEPARGLLARLARGPATAAALRREAAGPGGKLDDSLQDLLRDGLIAARQLERAPRAQAASERVASLAPGVTAEAALAGVRAPAQAALLARIARAGSLPVRELEREQPGAAARLRALAARGLLELGRRPAPRDVLGERGPAEPPPALTPEQSDAVKEIADAIRAQRCERFLLHGVTGSGKTEVYLHAIAEALAQGRQALVLVPEITLTHQILARLRGRFGDGLAVLHSGLSPGERLEQWQRLRAGATPIAVGARSALFAPLEKLGVIVIDEEHDGAYKNEEGFRYHARELAGRRAAAAACPLVLGSATPSLESRFAADRGRLRRLVLARRIGDRPLPAVTIVDLVRERELSPRGRRVVLSGALERALRETLAGGGQSILLLNRRGFSTQVFCFACGAAERCQHCDIALVYHATAQQLRCHYCDFQIPPPERCSQCGAPDTSLLGTGTERLEEELRARLPEARIARLDRDAAQQRGYTARVLRELRERRLDVLIGTQMVAKGHDFPGVQLVGVVLADVGLHLPDFRAAERTFQLLTQVAGRAGRDRAPGRVIVQTYAPGHPAIRPVRDHDYESFYAEELGQRAALGYPPFGRLVQAIVQSADAAAALAGAQALALAAAAPDGPEVLGPAPAPIARLRGKHRFQLLLKGADPERLHAAARRVVEATGQLPRGVQASVDAFPVNML
ncbi:MAG TPA: primosomal protein N' [Myxococcota bacterium]|jgi:primosomal protein N' (replication factor Y)